MILCVTEVAQRAQRRVTALPALGRRVKKCGPGEGRLQRTELAYARIHYATRATAAASFHFSVRRSALNVERSRVSTRERSRARPLVLWRVESPARRGAAWHRSLEERARRSRSTSSQRFQARGEGTPPTRGTESAYARIHYAARATAAALFHFGVRRSALSVERSRAKSRARPLGVPVRRASSLERRRLAPLAGRTRPEVAFHLEPTVSGAG